MNSNQLKQQIITNIVGWHFGAQEIPFVELVAGD